MKVVLALCAALVGSACGNPLHAAVSRKLGEIKSVAEGAARDLGTADAIQCASAEPCKTNNCMSIAGLALGACSPLIYNFSTIASTDASDNKCLGMAALMVDANMTLEDDTAICTAFNATNWTNTCVRDVPFKAIINTITRHINGTCKVFAQDIFGLLGIPTGERRMLAEDDSEEAATPTETQEGIMQAAGAAVMGADATAAMTALGLKWSMFSGPILGMAGASVESAIMTKAGSCLTVTHFGISNYSGASAESKALAVAILQDQMTNNGTFYTTEQVKANLTALTGPAAVLSWAASLPIDFVTGWNETMQRSDGENVTIPVVNVPQSSLAALAEAMAGAAGQGLQNITVNQTEFATEVGMIAIALANSTVLTALDLPANVSNVLQMAIYSVFIAQTSNATNADEIQSLVEGICEDDAECIAASSVPVWAFFQIFDRTTGWVTTKMDPATVMATITATIMSSADVMMVMSIPDTMATCFNAPYEGLKPLLAMFQRLANGGNATSDMAVATGLALATGCGLARADQTTGADPAMANMQSCYLLAIGKKDMALLMAAKSKAFTQDQIFGMKDSMANVQRRCTAVDYPLGKFPAFVDAAEPSTKSPTTLAPTSPPNTNAPTMAKLSNAVNLHPALALVAAALLALL